MRHKQAHWRDQTNDNAKINFLCESITDVSLPENSFDMAASFNESIRKGKVTAKYDDDVETSSGSEDIPF